MEQVRDLNKQFITPDMLDCAVEEVKFCLYQWFIKKNLCCLASTAYHIQQAVEKAIKIQLQEFTEDEKQSFLKSRENRVSKTFEEYMETHDIALLITIGKRGGGRFLNSEYFDKLKGKITKWETLGRYYPRFYIDESVAVQSLNELTNWVSAIYSLFDFTHSYTKPSYIEYVARNLQRANKDDVNRIISSLLANYFKISESNKLFSLPSMYSYNKNCIHKIPEELLIEGNENG